MVIRADPWIATTINLKMIMRPLILFAFHQKPTG